LAGFDTGVVPPSEFMLAFVSGQSAGQFVTKKLILMGVADEDGKFSSIDSGVNSIKRSFSFVSPHVGQVDAV